MKINIGPMPTTSTWTGHGWIHRDLVRLAQISVFFSGRFRSRTPGPSPFSSMNTTPADFARLSTASSEGFTCVAIWVRSANLKHYAIVFINNHLFSVGFWLFRLGRQRNYDKPSNCFGPTRPVRLFRGPSVNSLFQLRIKPQADRFSYASARATTTSLF